MKVIIREIKAVRNMGGNRTVKTQGINNNRQCLFNLENKKAKGDFDYAEEHNHTKHNYMLEDLIGDALDLSDNERQMLCRVE